MDIVYDPEYAIYKLYDNKQALILYYNCFFL